MDAATGPAGPSPTNAWDDPFARSTFVRLRWIGRAWLVIAVAAFVGFSIYIVRLDEHKAWLEANGTSTTAVVVEDAPKTTRCRQVGIGIEFLVGDHRETHDYYVQTCGGGAGVSKGDRLDIVYDPADPSDFLVGGKTNDTPFATVASIVGFGAWVVFGIGWIVRARRLRRMRRVLQHHPWTDTAARTAPVRGTLGSRCAIELGSGEATEVFVTQVLRPPRLAALTGDVTSITLAGSPGGPIVLTDDTHGDLTLARHPSSDRKRRGAEQALHSSG